jgi:hypothetical protein
VCRISPSYFDRYPQHSYFSQPNLGAGDLDEDSWGRGPELSPPVNG